MTQADLASRVLKARWPGRCALCHGGIVIGEMIGQQRRGWSHVACIVLALADLG